MYLIDFGLSSVSISTHSGLEEKIIDLFVIKRAIITSNPKSEELIYKAMNIYEKNVKMEMK